MRARLNFADPDGKPVTVELSSDLPVTIGRSRDNHVIIRDEHASRMHARIHCDNGAWHVRDFGLNGTKLNGEKIDQEAVVKHGDEVRIGDTRMRFSILEVAPGGPATKRIQVPAEPAQTTRIQYVDLAVLNEFMTGAVHTTDISTLLRQALEIILHQTSAYLVGFLSDDSNNPQTKIVVPDTVKVDTGLAKQLNRRVQKEGKTVWLCCDVADTRTPECFAQFSDALCIPVRSAAGRSHGTIHIYRLNAYFSDRDLKICESIVSYLANCIQVQRHQRALEADNLRFRGRLFAADEFVGDSQALRELRDRVARVASKSTAVLVRGEPGVGKELVALTLHRQSHRSHGPFATVNCAAISGPSFESEVFGYRKAAIPGAKDDHLGILLQSDEGTVFFDEIGEVSLACQDKLIRLLETRSFRHVGGTTDIHVNVRLVAATQRNLDEDALQGRFRPELLRRLQETIIDVPPLRQHADDIPMLAQYFLDKIGAEYRRQYRLTDAALKKLCQHKWPGNIRQLRIILEGAATLGTELLDSKGFLLDETAFDHHQTPLNLVEHERWAVAEALKRAGGNKTKAAGMLGINRETLYAKIEKYGVDRKLAETVT